MTDKQKIMLVTGCSHSAGFEIDGTEDSTYNRSMSFGNQLARIMGYKPVNIALGSQSNSAIARSVIEWVQRKYNPETMEVFVVIGWTECTRMDLPSGHDVDHDSNNIAVDYFTKSTKRFLQINSGWEGFTPYEKSIMPYWHEFMVKNEHILEIMSVKDALSIQWFLKGLGIKYIMCNTMPNFKKNRYTEFYIDQLNPKYFMDMLDEDKAFFWYYRNQGYENPKAQYWHHDEMPHRLQAERLYNFILDQT
jgi:hypothetical protein